MSRTRRDFLTRAGALLLTSALPGRASAARPSVDISYLWSRSRDAVLEYREVVGEILGPAVAKDLRIVKGAVHYGLVYDRAGTDPAAAEQVAREHQRLLSKHFETDDPLAVTVVDRGYRRLSEAPKKATRNAPRPRTAAPRRPSFPGLPATSDTALRHRVNALIQEERSRSARVSEQERTAWYVYTLHDDRTWVAINADRPMQCASMVKPFIALAYAHEVKEGRLRWDPAAKRWLKSMLVWSDNPSTNRLMRRVGGPRKVQSVLSRHYRAIFRTTSIVEYIPRDGRTYRNLASARDYVRFARALWHRKLPASERILELMAASRRSRIEPKAAEVRVAHKTGTTARLCGNFGIVEADEMPYVMVGIIERNARAEGYATWLDARASVIRDVSTVVYTELASHYRAAPIGAPHGRSRRS